MKQREGRQSDSVPIFNYTWVSPRDSPTLRKTADRNCIGQEELKAEREEVTEEEEEDLGFESMIRQGRFPRQKDRTLKWTTGMDASVRVDCYVGVTNNAEISVA